MKRRHSIRHAGTTCTTRRGHGRVCRRRPRFCFLYVRASASWATRSCSTAPLPMRYATRTVTLQQRPVWEHRRRHAFPDAHRGDTNLVVYGNVAGLAAGFCPGWARTGEASPPTRQQRIRESFLSVSVPIRRQVALLRTPRRNRHRAHSGFGPSRRWRRYEARERGLTSGGVRVRVQRP